MKSQTRRNFLKVLSTAGLSINAGPILAFHEKKNQNHKELPIINEVDICVIGGSCTGVFAAIRAARLGAKVAIIEKQNSFGGVATSGLVNIWHSLFDTEKLKQIIAGLTLEVTDRLAKRDAVIYSQEDKRGYFTLNTQELIIELDELVIESGIVPYLHTLFSEPYINDHGILSGVIIDNKSVRGIIKAKYFIDATGDGDLCERLGLKSYFNEYLQPPTMCANIEGFDSIRFNSLLKQHGKEFNIPDGYVWGSKVPSTNSYMLAGTRIYGYNCADANELTKTEFEGRRQIRAIMDLMRKYDADHTVGLTCLPSYVGIRETRHINCLYQVTDNDALYGKNFEDAIANGSYVLDLHHQDKPGITFRYLDGTEEYSRPGYPEERRRWREETPTNPTFYQVPLRSLIPENTSNIIVAGRMLDASMVAFSGIRVMVNMNQLGEAAGITAFLALNQNKRIPDISFMDVRKKLAEGGSLII